MKHQTALTGRVLGYKAQQVYAYICLKLSEDGIAPSYSMIDEACDCGGRHKVWKIVNSLERRALVSRVGTGRVPRNTVARNVRRISLGVGQ